MLLRRCPSPASSLAARRLSRLSSSQVANQCSPADLEPIIPEPQSRSCRWPNTRAYRTANVRAGLSPARPELRPQEIEVAALVGLEDVLEVEPAPPAAVGGRGRAPFGAAAGQRG